MVLLMPRPADAPLPALQSTAQPPPWGIPRPLPCRRTACRRFIQPPRFDDPALRQVLDDRLDELNLVGRMGPTIHERHQGLLGSGAIQPDQASHEQPQTRAVGLRLIDLVRRTGPARQQHRLQLGQVCRGQRQIGPQLPDGDVILVRLQEMPRLLAEPRKCVGRDKPIEDNLLARAVLVFEVSLEHAPLRPLYQVHRPRDLRRARSSSCAAIRSPTICESTRLSSSWSEKPVRCAMVCRSWNGIYPSPFNWCGIVYLNNREAIGVLSRC